MSYTNSELIPGKWKKDKRHCERPNYIPHFTPTNSNRQDWHYTYLPQLIDMYEIVAQTIDEKYPKRRIRWSQNEKVAHNLSRLIYHCSSKYITPHLEQPWDESEFESKDLED